MNISLLLLRLTVGCLRHQTNLESLILFITDILDLKNAFKEREHKFSMMKNKLLNFKRLDID